MIWLPSCSNRARAIAPEVIEENHRPLKDQMASLRIFDLRRECPTNAGILLFGKDPRFWIPGAYVQFLRVRGMDLSDEIAQDKELSGDLLTILRELDMLLECRCRAGQSQRLRYASKRSRITRELRYASS